MMRAATGDLSGLGRRKTNAENLANNKRYLMPLEGSPRTKRMWNVPGDPLDQGGTSQCVAYSGFNYLRALPVINKLNRLPWTSPEPLYELCQDNDEWQGTDYDGTSVHALGVVLKKLGYITEYRWGYSVAPVVAHLLEKGPVCMGTDWKLDMFTPDRWGYIWPEGPNEGGHAWTLVGVDTKRANPDGTAGAVRMENSWGPSWAQGGRAWVSLGSLGQLIAADGEAMVATEVIPQ